MQNFNRMFGFDERTGLTSHESTWRNPTVVALCEFMRHGQNTALRPFSPTLYKMPTSHDEELLKTLRDPLVSLSSRRRWSQPRIYSDEHATLLSGLSGTRKNLVRAAIPAICRR